jgi:hypothetical protein
MMDKRWMQTLIANHTAPAAVVMRVLVASALLHSAQLLHERERL